MSNLKKEYDEILEQRTAVLERLKQLENDENVKRYLELTKENDSLYEKQLNFYRTIKYEEYSECKHILIYSKTGYDNRDGIPYRTYGCIKCGLDASVFDKEESELSDTSKIMYDYLLDHNFDGIKTYYLCDIDLATSIYSKIKDAHSDIDDETAIKYFKNSLDNIRNIPVNDKRKISRAKRLALNPDFKRWLSSDISD